MPQLMASPTVFCLPIKLYSALIRHRLKNPLPRSQAFVGPTLTLGWQANIDGPTLKMTLARRYFTHPDPTYM